MTRIAHVDRPTGARAVLYPTISDLKPILCFETSHDLLVAWGDCVMTMHVKETIVKGTPETGGGALPGLVASGGPSADFTQSVVKRRQVECSMAWELDCIACGVVPMDEDRLVVMGLVPTLEEETERDEGTMGPNDVEMQIISRKEGTVVYADVIPVITLPSQYKTSNDGTMQESASAYSLLSTFALPRMDNAIEAEEQGAAAAVEQDFEFNLFSSGSKLKFEDAHVKWNLNSVVFDVVNEPTDEAGEGEDKEEEEEHGEEEKKEDKEEQQAVDKEDDVGSVDSDDYGFILRPAPKSEEKVDLGAIPPVMAVIAPADMVSVRTSDADDAVEHALTLKKLALALERGLRHKRKLRNHDLDNLVDLFLKAVLRIDTTENAVVDGAQRSLSIRRLKLGAAATPRLLGGNTRLWKRWLREFTKVPGALFIISECLPVRGTFPGLVLFARLFFSLM